jgi:hypothetical protein
MEFYVYQYISESGLPYYIGKGCGRRIHRPHGHTILPPVERRVIIQDGLTNDEAKKLEGELITKYGRKLDGGILDNIKINQWACAVGWKHSDETRRKISEGNKGKKRTPEQRKNYKGTVTAEHKEKVRQANLGRKDSPERREKIRQANLGKKLSPETIAKRQASYRKTIEARTAALLKEILNGN